MRHALQFTDASPRQGDPTGTAGIRRSFRAAAKLRLRQLRSQLRIAVLEHNLLGLGGVVENAASSQPLDTRLKSFNGWLQAVAPGVLNGPWLSHWVARAWASGAQVAASHVVAEVVSDAGSGALLTLAQAELDGITAAVVQQVTREAGRALANSKMKRMRVWQRLARVIDKVGEPRLCALANTITVMAHNHGRGAVFREAGYSRVGIIPEHAPLRTDAVMFAQDKRATSSEYEYAGNQVSVETAGDDFVCDDCEDFADGSPYDIDDALDALPIHPGCRCSFVVWHGDEADDSATLDAFNSDEPRDPDGKWTEGGGSK